MAAQRSSSTKASCTAVLATWAWSTGRIDTAADLMSDVRDAAAKILAKAINVDHGPTTHARRHQRAAVCRALFGKEASITVRIWRRSWARP